MEDEFKLDLTREEAIRMDEQIEQMLAAMRNANERMARDQIEIDRLKAETLVLLADLQRMLGGDDCRTLCCNLNGVFRPRVRNEFRMY